jgi:hypothetical protein
LEVETADDIWSELEFIDEPAGVSGGSYCAQREPAGNQEKGDALFEAGHEQTVCYRSLEKLSRLRLRRKRR